MALKEAQARVVNILTNSYGTAADLSALQFCAVAPSESASGRMEIKVPSGQGVLTTGILVTYNATSGVQAEVQEEGMTKAIASAAFNNGVELTVAGTSGKLEAASSGDYVIGIAYEAAAEADQKVTIRLVSPYQKN